MITKSGKIPHEYIPDLIINGLAQKGKTTKEIENERGVAYTLDEERPNGNVWHNASDLRIYIAKFLKLDASLWGPNRTSDIFETEMSHSIAKLRKHGEIKSWKVSNSLVLRLSSAARKPKSIPVMTMMDTVPAYTELIPNTSDDYNMIQGFQSILRYGAKHGTYKFALARAILEHCNDKKNYSMNKYEITYEYLADKFLKYYWHQVCKFKMKQDFSPQRETMAVQIIRKIFDESSPVSFNLIQQKDRKNAREQILHHVFGSIKSKKSQVVPKFQKIKVGSRSEEHNIFYNYSNDEKKIILKPKAFEFFSKHNGILSGFVLVEWAKFLERINGNLPCLVAKIEMDPTKRKNLTKARKILLDHVNNCFYCNDQLEPKYIHVDHFIPWSYIFEDCEWNLVLACSDCNLKKSDSLAESDFKKELINRNISYYNREPSFKRSLDMLGFRRSWEKEIHDHYHNCREYGFNVIPLP